MEFFNYHTDYRFFQGGSFTQCSKLRLDCLHIPWGILMNFFVQEWLKTSPKSPILSEWFNFSLNVFLKERCMGWTTKLAFSRLKKLRGFFSSILRRLLANMCPNNKIYWDLTLCLKPKLVLCCNVHITKNWYLVGVELSNNAHKSGVKVLLAKIHIENGGWFCTITIYYRHTLQVLGIVSNMAEKHCILLCFIKNIFYNCHKMSQDGGYFLSHILSIIFFYFSNIQCIMYFCFALGCNTLGNRSVVSSVPNFNSHICHTCYYFSLFLPWCSIWINIIIICIHFQ